MNKDLDVLTVKEISEEYKIDRRFVYDLLNMKNCPLLSGKDGKKYRITRGHWGSWLQQVGHNKTA